MHEKRKEKDDLAWRKVVFSYGTTINSINTITISSINTITINSINTINYQQ